MEAIFVEMDRGGVGFLTHGKRQSCAYCQYSNLPAKICRQKFCCLLFGS